MNQTEQFQIGIDIGGTFTDFSLFDRDNRRLFVHKQLTTPANPLQSVREGLGTLTARAKIHLSEVSRISHATTLVANAILERKSDITGLLCTKGFVSIFDIGKEQRYDLYDLRIEFPCPLIPLPLRREIGERINSKGEIESDFSEREVIDSVQELIDEHGIKSLAICFINSYRNPVHEEKVKAIVEREFPDISISTSADVFSSIREYERWTTTLVNACTQSILKSYLSELDEWLKDNGFAGELFLIVSDGGMVNTDIARQYPVRMLASGSAATVLMCGEISRKSEYPDLLMFDMGGTTTKLGVIKNGHATKRYDIEVGRIYQNKKGSGITVSTPVFDLVEIASGGCSIASIDQRGVLQVGPESMGALPGPACFGFAGEQATTTDANLLLGFYGEDTFLGGNLKINLNLAEQSIEKNLADKLNTSAARTAWGIYESVNERILTTIRTYSAERGFDYRSCTLVVSGGAAAAHAMNIARKLELKKVVIPLASGVASATGLLTAPLAFESLQSYRVSLNELSRQHFINQFSELENKILKIISGNKMNNREATVVRRLDMRYLGQGFEIELTLPVSTELAKSYDSLSTLFNQAYKQQFFSCFLDQEIEIINWKAEVTITASNSLGEYTLDYQQGEGEANALLCNRKVYSFKENTYAEWPVYNRYALKVGDKMSGPLLIQDHETTSVFFQGDEVEVDRHLNLVAKPVLSYD